MPEINSNIYPKIEKYPRNKQWRTHRRFELLSCTEMPVSSTTCAACRNMLQAWMRWRINWFCLSSAEWRYALFWFLWWEMPSESDFQVTRAQYSVYCIENAIPSNNWYQRVVAISFSASGGEIGFYWLAEWFFQFHHLTITIDHRRNLLFHAERKSLHEICQEISWKLIWLIYVWWYRFSVFFS